MKLYSVIEKRVGETPLQALERYRDSYPEYKDIPIAYAGRLDPMASGKLLLLLGEECKNQEKYHTLDKAYTFSVLFGFTSDTGDILGIIDTLPPTNIYVADIKSTVKILQGSITLPYPHFSSKTVKGKPLHVWAVEDRLHEIDIPHKTTTIYRIRLKDFRSVGMEILYDDALQRIQLLPTVTEASKAKGKDFRRKEVKLSWETAKNMRQRQTYQIATFECIASSGAYMRSLAEEIGRRLNTKALAYHIHRTTIGKYRHIGPFGFWTKTF